jgi:pilus assembly protein Flp/PilA
MLTFIHAYLQSRVGDERGSVAAEYGLLIALIAVVMAVGATFLGEAIRDLFNGVAGDLGGGPPAAE